MMRRAGDNLRPSQSREGRAALVLCALLATVVLYAIGTAVYYARYERSWLAYCGLPWKTDKTAYRPGETVIVYTDRENRDTQKHTYLVGHSLICAKNPEHILPGDVPTLLPGRHPDGISHINFIPPDIRPPDRCHFEGTGETKGQVRAISVPWSTVEFDVVP